MKVAIYSRKSKFTDKGESAENQINMCQEYALNHIPNLKKSDILIYKDEGFSGKNTERPGFQKMMSDLKNNMFSYIICYKLDRISRNINDFSNLIEKLISYNISFVCIKEQFDTSVPIGRAMMYIASVFSQLERETIAERVKDNMMMLAKNAQWLGGTTPYGLKSVKITTKDSYGKVKHKFNLRTDESKIDNIKIIYSIFLKTQSFSEVKRYLEKPNSNLKNFSITGIKKILRNPIYCIADKDAFNFFKKVNADICFTENNWSDKFGVFSYNKYHYQKNCASTNDYSKWIISVGTHTGIISGRNWIKTQKIISNISKNKSHNKKSEKYSILSGYIKCKKCGGKMLTKIRNTKSKFCFDYICSNKIYKGLNFCQCKNLNGVKVDKEVFTGCVKKLLSQSKSKKLEKIMPYLKHEDFFDKTPINIKQEFINSTIKEIVWDGEALKIYFK